MNIPIPCQNGEACLLRHDAVEDRCNEYCDRKFEQTVQLLNKLVWAMCGCVGAILLMVGERILEVMFF